jgi:hypothetical protein
MTARLASSLALLAALTLSACGKIGPYTVEINPKQRVNIVTLSEGELSLEPGQKLKGLATYFPASKRLELEIGSEKLVFKKTKINQDTGELLAHPDFTEVRTTSGESLGLQSKRSLVCNPDCERVERETRVEDCTYYETYPEVHCRYFHGRQICDTVFVRRPVRGHQTVEYVNRTRDYSIDGSIYGLALGDVALTHAEMTEIDTDIRVVSACR